MQFDKDSLDFFRKTSQEYIKNREIVEKTLERKESFRFWFPVILSNLMSFIAIIISAIALFATYHK